MKQTMQDVYQDKPNTTEALLQGLLMSSCAARINEGKESYSSRLD